MKNITITLILFLLVGQLFAQGPDSARYTRYRYIYGNRQSRQWADTVLIIPKDTIWSKDGLARKNTVLYVGNGTRWTAVSGGAGYDSTIMATLYGLDTAKANIRSKIRLPTDSILYTQSADIRDTTITTSFPCSFSPASVPYAVYHFPAFIGYRLRVSDVAQTWLQTYCEFGFWYAWYPDTGDVYLYNASSGMYVFFEAY